ncbi:MAG: hypothetical protein J6R42_02720 [Clostridia bacterium]|nr:hypothetical protein [Clostridia bacterium]
MKRRAIAVVLFLSFIFNIAYCATMAYVVFMDQTQQKVNMMEKLNMEVDMAIAETFSIPVLYFIFALITLLMQLVLILSFSNSMRFEKPTLWIEVVSIVLYGGVFRIFYHYIPAMESRFALLRGWDGLASRELLNQCIQNLDWIFALSSALFLAGAGMTICFKKFVRYFMK